MQRIEAFLGEDEVDAWASSIKSSETIGVKNEKIGFRRGVFEWNAPPQQLIPPNRFQLGPVDVDFPIGQLSLITGATGSGKSALLAALLGGQ